MLSFLDIALAEAYLSREENGIPIGAALFSQAGRQLGTGHNRRIQDNNPALHGETDAFINAGRQKNYRHTIMVTTCAPCWYCSGLIIQFGIPKIIVGDAVNFTGGLEWLLERKVEVTVLNDPRCIDLLSDFIIRNHDLWAEDIGHGS